MALSVQDGVLTWQKVKAALVGANPAAQDAFRTLRVYLATQGGNPQLQFAAFAAEDIVTNTGYRPIGGACTLYGLYCKGRRTTGTTAAFVAAHDAADNAATTTTIVTSKFALTGQTFYWTSPGGIAFATDVTLSCATAVGGATESSAADAGDGFIIVGA